MLFIGAVHNDETLYGAYTVIVAPGSPLSKLSALYSVYTLALTLGRYYRVLIVSSAYVSYIYMCVCTRTYSIYRSARCPPLSLALS